MLFSKGPIQMGKECFLNVDYGSTLYLKGNVLSLGASCLPPGNSKGAACPIHDLLPSFDMV